MAYAPHITPEVRDEIIAAKTAGERISTIAKRLGVGRATIYRTWFRHRHPDRKAPPKPVQARTEPAPRPDVVLGLHGVSLPRLRCMEPA